MRPTFSLKRLLLSIALVGVGLGAIKYSLSGSSMPHAFIMMCRVLGWGAICSGIIPLLTASSPLPVLGFSLGFGGIPGLAIAGLIAAHKSGGPVLVHHAHGPGEQLQDLMPWIGMMAGSGIVMFAVLVIDYVVSKTPED